MSASWISRGTVLVRLGRHHFAFFRGYLDGVDLRKLYERYIDPSADAMSGESNLKAARALLAWIVDQLVVSARRYGQAPAARILRMTPEKLGAVQGSNVPDLAQFQEDRDPHQMYSEHELLTLFSEEYGAAASRADRRAQRNRRLRAKQAALLNHLEMQTAKDPQLGDDISGWLDPVIARRLNDVGIFTLKELVELIESHGFRWYTKVPRVGIKAAQYVVDWLMLPETAGGLGVALSIRSTHSRKQIDAAALPAPILTTGIVPIERFAVPTSLSGVAGMNRCKASSLAAGTDRDAILAWLARSPSGSSTARAYRKEAERLLLWSVLEAKKPLSSLTAADCINYRYFLAHLGRQSEAAWSERFQLLQEKWMAPRGIDRFSSRWRPFEGPLSPASQKVACAILQGMMAWMCEMNYLLDNPFKEKERTILQRAPRVESSELTVRDLTFALEFLDHMQHDNSYHRLRFILLTIYHTGCSLAELAMLRGADIVRASPRESVDRFELLIWRNAKIVRRICLNERMQAEAERYLRHKGYASLKEVAMETPLIAALSGDKQTKECATRLSASRLYTMIKLFLSKVADSIEASQPERAKTFRQASPKSIKKLSAFSSKLGPPCHA